VEKRGKYDSLTNYLRNLPTSTNQVVLTFEQIGKIIAPHKLPPSARRYQNTGFFNLRTWDNVHGNVSGRVLADAWLDAGFETIMLDFQKEKVKFKRIQEV